MQVLLVIAGIYLLSYIFGKLSRRAKKQKPASGSSTFMIETSRQSAYPRSRSYQERRRARPTQKTYEIELPPDFILTNEFRSAFELMETTSDNIFITGKAGTGKSTLLQYFRINTKKNIAVLAPTGVAALNVGGKTIHSFFKLPPRLIQKQDVHPIRNGEVIRKLDTLVIDEVSMVRADLMDGIDLALRANRRTAGALFGGAQVIVLGDLYQLPPVVDSDVSQVFERLYESPYFFSSKAIRGGRLRCLELEEIHRQTDGHFISLLNHLRDGKIAPQDLALLNKRVISQEDTCGGNVLILTTTNEGANRINENKLQAINDKEYEYEAQVTGKFDTSSCPAEASLRLKKGAQVMIIRNDVNRRWVNGSMGRVASLSNTAVRVALADGTYDIQQETWERIDYQYNPDTDRIEAYVIGSFRQYPIKLAYAMTIHKSQGKTFDKVLIDLEKGAFAHGQAYVALSRCRTLDGIQLKRPLLPRDVIFDPVIYGFKNDNFSRKGI